MLNTVKRSTDEIVSLIVKRKKKVNFGIKGLAGEKWSFVNKRAQLFF